MDIKMYIVGSILLLVVLVIVIRYMVKASKASYAVYDQYQGVFGKGTTWGLFFCGLLMFQCIGGLVVIFIDGSAQSSVGETVLAVFITLVTISVCLIVSCLFIRRAKLRCPAELKEQLYRAIFIATVGVIGTYFRYSWNIFCGVVSVIPGLGWVANFIVTKDTSAKEAFVKDGEQHDIEYEERMRQEKENRKAEDERQRVEREDDLRKKVWKEQNRTDVVFNSDSSRWRYSDEDIWRKIEK